MGVKDLQDLKKISMLRSQIDGKDIECVTSTDFETIEPDKCVSDALRIMKEKNIQDICVLHGQEYMGVVNYGSLLKKKGILLDSKIKGTIVGAPTVTSSAKITDIAEMMIVNNSRLISVLDTHKQLVGVVRRPAMIQIAADIKAFRDIKVWEIMHNSVEVVKETDTLGTALDIMRALDIRTVPVVNDQRHVIGIVGMKEVIEHNWRKTEKRTVGDFGGAINHPELLVESVCATAPKTIRWDDTLESAARIMLDENISTLPVVDNNELVGIITQYDVIELIAACKERDVVFIQISGLDEEDKYFTESIYGSIEDELKKISKIYKPQALTMHVAKYKGNGNNHKYSISARLMLDGEVIISKEVGWDLTKTANDLMKKLSSSVMDMKDSKVTFRKRKK